jgi:hypothetical protein
VLDHQPIDRLTRGAQFRFHADPDRNALTVSLPAGEADTVHQRLHRHSIQQMALTTDLPLKFIDYLLQTREAWGQELLAHNLNTVFQNRFPRSRYLTRSIDGEVRGFFPMVIIASTPDRSSKRSRQPYKRRARCHTTAMSPTQGSLAGDHA